MRDTDELYMSRAIQLARLGAGNVSTNPMVGAVIVRDGVIIGEGFHRKYGEAHAEVNAVASVGDRSLIEGSTVYVNLEPCSHYGKTPPCCDLLIGCKVARVVVGMQDPFLQVAGKGIARMREAGIDVTVGVLEKESRFLNRRFITFNTKKRPYVIVKYARTLDGYIDSGRKARTSAPWLTGYACKVLVHRWRSEEDAVMAGTETILRDDPELTVREWYGSNPLRVTVDRKGRIAPDSKIFNGRAETLVLETGDIAEIMTLLYEKGVQSLFVEGGRALIESLDGCGLIDEVREFISPMGLSDIQDADSEGGVPAPLIHGLIKTKMENIGGVLLVTYLKEYGVEL